MRVGVQSRSVRWTTVFPAEIEFAHPHAFHLELMHQKSAPSGSEEPARRALPSVTPTAEPAGVRRPGWIAAAVRAWLAEKLARAVPSGRGPGAAWAPRWLVCRLGDWCADAALGADEAGAALGAGLAAGWVGAGDAAPEFDVAS